MPEPLRIVILEDRPADAQLIAKTMEKQGLEFVWERVDTLDGLVRALNVRADVILADYLLQGFTAIDAMEMMKQNGIEIPVIIVTGELGDEAAAECIRKGATDYILKDRPARLVSAIQAAIEQQRARLEERAAQEALRASETRTRLLVEASLDAVISTDSKTYITGWNLRAETMFGYTTDEVLGLPLLSVVAPASKHHEWRSGGVAPISAKSIRHRANRFETMALRRSGQEFPVEVAVSSAPLNETAMLGVVVRDLSDRIRTETALAQAREDEDRAAERIQKALLIGNPDVATEAYDVAVQVKASRLISGDFVGTWVHSEKVLDVLIGDVMGKGLMAALVGAITKNNFHEAQRQLGRWLEPFDRLPTPQEVVSVVHQRMSSELTALESFVTLVFARFDAETKQCTIIDCGHTGIAHVSSQHRTCTLMNGHDMPLGFTEHALVTPVSIPFELGDLFFFYSDGVIDAENDAGETFGTRRLREVLVRAYGQPPQSVTTEVLRAVSEFSAGVPPRDDITCVAVSVASDIPEKPILTSTLEIPCASEHLPRVREFARSFCDAVPGSKLPEETVVGLVLAVHEAATNVIQHAHERRSDLVVQIIAEAYPDRVELRVFDLGAGFAAADVPEPTLGVNKEQPLGLYFIKQSVNQWEYRRDNLGRNVLWLVVRR